MLIILDPAHGIDTPGKRSPDGKFRECIWSREICNRLYKKIQDLNPPGIQVIFSTKLDIEPGLPARVAVANRFPLKPSLKFFLSIHANAAGMGDVWMNARGYSIWTHRGETKSDEYATKFFKQFKKDFPELPTRADYSDGDPDYESNFYVLSHTTCPAVLIETMFQDNKDDVKILNSEPFKSKFVDSLCTAIIQIAA